MSRVEQIYERVLGTEAENEEVEADDLGERVKQIVEEILQEKNRLQPRKSAVVEEEDDGQKGALNPRERLRVSVNRAFSQITNEV